jgi:hypothetical protein
MASRDPFEVEIGKEVLIEVLGDAGKRDHVLTPMIPWGVPKNSPSEGP